VYYLPQGIVIMRQKQPQTDKPQKQRKPENQAQVQPKQPLIIKLTFYRRFITKKSNFNSSENTLLSFKPLIIGNNDKRILETIY
jgi:hypothetical protein